MIASSVSRARPGRRSRPCPSHCGGRCSARHEFPHHDNARRGRCRSVPHSTSSASPGSVAYTCRHRNPCTRRRRRQWPEWTFQRTPRPIRAKPVKQWRKMRGRAASRYINCLLLVLGFVFVNVWTGPVPACPGLAAEAAGEAVPRSAREAAGGRRGGVRRGRRVPGRRTRGGGTAKRAGHGGGRRQKGAGKGAGKGASADSIRAITIRSISRRKLAGKFRPRGPDIG